MNFFDDNDFRLSCQSKSKLSKQFVNEHPRKFALWSFWCKMKRKQGVTSEIKYAVMETIASSGTFVEFMPQLWVIPPKNKAFQHKERDTVKFLFPLRLPQQTKDNFIKFVKQAKFNCIPAERNEKWELRDGRILKMGIGSYVVWGYVFNRLWIQKFLISTTVSLKEALDAEKFYSDYFSTTEGEMRENLPSPAKKTVRKRKELTTSRLGQRWWWTRFVVLS